MEGFIAFLTNLLQNNILEKTFSVDNPSGLLILFFLAVVTDIGLPVPFVLDSILMLTAYNVLTTHEQTWTTVVLIVIMLFVGRQVGSSILYLLSRVLGKVFINWLKCHFPIIGNRLDFYRERLDRWSPLAVATGRLTPGLLQITSVIAGTMCLRYYYFSLGIAISSIVYDGILIFFGYIAAHSSRSLDTNFGLWLMVGMIVIVCLLWPVVFICIQRSCRKAAQSVKTNACNGN
jgi:membrane protein DedA with SNARE-associated domain